MVNNLEFITLIVLGTVIPFVVWSVKSSFKLMGKLNVLINKLDRLEEEQKYARESKKELFSKLAENKENNVRLETIVAERIGVKRNESK